MLIKKTTLDVKKQYAASPYHPDMIDHIQKDSYQAVIDPSLLWEMLLVEIRHVIIRYASRLKKDRSTQMRELEKALQLLHDNNEEDTEEFITKKEQLETMRSKLMEGVLIRSRARWIGDGEKMSKYFLNLEKRHFASKTMTSLIKEDGTEITDH
ncbi:reverse transcriptase [Elysia marginata]|uniref:Reverse transcriptase n=1 Tax=Elysia marginata TaxID=1093978 RepID=A0AAV4H5V6_9GAST|nr:reverse transcriptase [Elysia marginata]